MNQMKESKKAVYKINQEVNFNYEGKVLAGVIYRIRDDAEGVPMYTICGCRGFTWFYPEEWYQVYEEDIVKVIGVEKVNIDAWVIALSEFRNKFNFSPERTLQIGVERERFLCKEGVISPMADKVCSRFARDSRVGYELSACQLEDRVGPCNLRSLRKRLQRNDGLIAAALEKEGLHDLFVSVAPEDMPLDVYPDPSGRYQQLVKTMPAEVLSAACRVAGTHVHVGMPGHAAALHVYNQLTDHFDELVKLGDNCSGERLRLYQVVASEYRPPRYSSWDDYYTYALENGFVENPRNCWHMVRISLHGTIEFRMFGTTPDHDQVVRWAKYCHELCMKYL